jgi:hypothetical protein
MADETLSNYTYQVYAIVLLKPFLESFQIIFAFPDYQKYCMVLKLFTKVQQLLLVLQLLNHFWVFNCGFSFGFGIIKKI